MNRSQKLKILNAAIAVESGLFGTYIRDSERWGQFSNAHKLLLELIEEFEIVDDFRNEFREGYFNDRK